MLKTLGESVFSRELAFHAGGANNRRLSQSQLFELQAICLHQQHHTVLDAEHKHKASDDGRLRRVRVSSLLCMYVCIHIYVCILESEYNKRFDDGRLRFSLSGERARARALSLCM
jgi:hypothetical protein